MDLLSHFLKQDEWAEKVVSVLPTRKKSKGKTKRKRTPSKKKKSPSKKKTTQRLLPDDLLKTII